MFSGTSRLRVLLCSIPLLFAAVAFGTAQAPVTPAAHPRVLLLTLDGGAMWLFDRWRANGTTPALNEMYKAGASVTGVIAAVPTLTAVAHATLWTGAPPRVHGIAANALLATPASAHTLAETESGFDSRALRVDPIWLTAVRSGRRALIISAPQSYPFAQAPRGLLRAFDSYTNQLVRPSVVRGTLQAARYTVDTPAGPAELSTAGGRLQLRLAGRVLFDAKSGDRVWTNTLTARVRGTEGQFRIGLLDWNAAERTYCLYVGRVSTLNATSPADARELLARAGPLVDDGDADYFYRTGRFGRTIAEGGDGRAEEDLLEILRMVQHYFDASLEFATTVRWELAVAYIPTIDMAAHAFAGMIDPASSHSSPALAARVWPLMDRVGSRLIDPMIGRLRRQLPGVNLVVCADHGFEGAGRQVFPNAILRDAGLLATSADGVVDWSRTKAWVGDRRAGLVTLNTRAHAGGIVDVEDEPSVKRTVTAALLAARDPDTGAAPIRAVLDGSVDGLVLGVNPSDGADLVLDPSRDYAINVSLKSTAVAAELGPAGEGSHGSLPTRRTMLGMFVAAGPGVMPDRRLGLVPSSDIAPTVSRLLRIPAPAQATGHAMPIVR